MSYLVIYPKRLMIQKLESDHCPGTLLCDVLQYGLMVEAMRTSVAMVFEDAGPNGFYRIEVRQMEAITQRYVMKFERVFIWPQRHAAQFFAAKRHPHLERVFL